MQRSRRKLSVSLGRGEKMQPIEIHNRTFINNTVHRKRPMSLVQLRYQDLIDGKDLTEEIFRAFGPEGLGALTISGIPEYEEKRKKLLSLSHSVAHLSDESLSKLEHPDSLWNTGWSRGKEKFAGSPDFSKGSFYGNPLFDQPIENSPNKDLPNLWPDEEIPEVRPAFKELGQLMTSIVILVAKQIDRLVSKHVPEYTPILHDALAASTKVKGREKEDNWIGWHNDSGFLTALTSAIFVNDETAEEVDNPDTDGGLWIVSRGGDPVHVSIPSDHMAMQLGECCQIVTGGLLVATPHMVRASKAKDGMKIGRATFPCFVGTESSFVLKTPEGITREQVFDRTPSSKVPPLPPRWTEGQTYGDFLRGTFSKFYDWNQKAATTDAI